ncbi:MAG: rhodanese-like domain-containing protein [Pyrinomonadaceae bacterium]
MRLLFSTAAALCLSVVVLVIAACNPEAYNGRANANGPTPGVATAPPAVPAAPAQPADDVRRITVAELKQALDAQQAVVIDVRGDAAFKTGHIHGAQMIPGAEIDKHAAELPKDKLIVTYCS